MTASLTRSVHSASLLDGEVVEENDFGSMRRITADNLPILNRLSIKRVLLNRGAMRTPHWHANANELTYCVSGTALVSVLSGIPVRADTAMTGEATLRGRVLPVGGIKEKVLAAHRLGLKRVVLPAASAGELRDVPREVRDALEIVLVTKMDEVLDAALDQPRPALRAAA